MPSFPTDRYGLVHRDAALHAGFSDEQLASAVERGDLVRVHPGVWVTSSGRPHGPDAAESLHRLRALAVATSGPARAHPLSHVSAAAVHGLSMLHPDLNVVHVTTGRPYGGSIRRQRHLHAAPLEPEEITEVDGVRVTSVERTAVDVACMGTFAQAIVVFDAALRRGADPDVLADTLSRRRRTSARNAKRAHYLSPTVRPRVSANPGAVPRSSMRVSRSLRCSASSSSTGRGTAATSTGTDCSSESSTACTRTVACGAQTKQPRTSSFVRSCARIASGPKVSPSRAGPGPLSSADGWYRFSVRSWRSPAYSQPSRDHRFRSRSPFNGERERNR
ncbi:hypothetical protein GCWB2_22325 [Gordonia rubripertincta]|nr:hypothetical protein GCWB2_22325 [Gordonia rubripertincta]